MIGNAAALLGILAIAVPILIHLLGRNQSRIQRFPTLRFIEASRLVPTRRRRISDLPLLLVRVAIVAVAAVALSQPYFACSGRTAPTAPASTISRAIIVDTSASTRRGATLDSARAHAVALQSGVIATTIESGDVRTAINGASAWLATRQGMRELVIVSDFQTGTIDSVAVPAEVGVDVVRIPASGPVSRVSSTPRQVAFLYGSICHPERSEGSASQEKQIPRCAQDDKLLAELQRDKIVQAAVSKPFGVGRDGDRLVISVPDDSLSLAAFALRDAVDRALNTAPPASELDSTTVPDAALAALRRDAQPVGGATPDATDSRWVWIAVLLLIALESWMRSRSLARATPALEESGKRERQAA